MIYDIIHFEALGKEADYLEETTKKLIQEGHLPDDFKYLITPNTLQEYIEYNEVTLPDIISTKTHSKLPDSYVKQGRKKSIITRSAGYDHFESLQNIINLSSLREYCVDAVAQTTIKFLYCITGYLNEYTYNTKTFERKKTNSFMELNQTRTATVYGVGRIGRQVYKNLVHNGLSVQAVDIRENELMNFQEYEDFNFVTAEEATLNTDIVINVMNLTKEENSRFFNVNYFNEQYWSQFKKPVFFINVTRGEIAPEETLLKFYNQGKILGIATDVFSNESILAKHLKENSFDQCEDKNILAAKEIIDKAISREENFYVQPHQGFNSDVAAKTKASEAMGHVVYWFNNGKDHFKEQLPYYI